jgi:ABC-type nitrate/sulfonate/bicarbonate transport system permease component
MFFFSMLADLWLGTWKWFAFISTYEISKGLQVLAIVLIFLGFIYWIFRSKFESMSASRGIVLRKESAITDWNSCVGAILLTVCCFLIWQVVASLFSYSGPVDVFKALSALVAGSDTTAGHQMIWTDAGISLLEIILGLILSFSMVLLATVLSIPPRLKPFTFPLLPLTHISVIVIYLLIFITLPYFVRVPDWLGVSHKALAVGLVCFFPIFQAFWGLRNEPKVYRVLMSLDDALPFAFVTMMFGEAMAATAGLGFVMIVASATSQRDKGVAVLLITTSLLVCLSFALRAVAKRLHLTKPVPVVAQAI